MMGIPDGTQDARAAAYVRKQEEKSFRGLLKLFNRACDATGRPRYEELCSPLPFRDATLTSSSPAKPANLGSPASASRPLVLTDAAPALVEGHGRVAPPPGLGWNVEEPAAAASPTTTQRSRQPTDDIQATWRGCTPTAESPCSIPDSPADFIEPKLKDPRRVSDATTAPPTSPTSSSSEADFDNESFCDESLLLKVVKISEQHEGNIADNHASICRELDLAKARIFRIWQAQVALKKNIREGDT